jgi:transporter family protein
MNEHKWLFYALAGAGCAALINVVSKMGLKKDFDPDAGTAIRSVVQAVFVVGFALVMGVHKHVAELKGEWKSWLSLGVAGVCGGLSWIFIFRALKLADNAKVAPIDKLSMPLSIVLGVMFLGERPSGVNWLGIGLIVVGTYLASQPRPA